MNEIPKFTPLSDNIPTFILEKEFKQSDLKEELKQFIRDNLQVKVFIGGLNGVSVELWLKGDNNCFTEWTGFPEED